MMTLREEPDPVTAAADYLLDRFGRHIVALMAYGSRVFGRPRRDSAYDFWVVVDDVEAFHRDNADFYRTELNVPSTPDEQIALNRAGPNFYAIEEDGFSIKAAVIGVKEFCDLCRGAWWTVKGRMQKPMCVFRTCPPVEQAVGDARAEGLECALSLVPREFTLDRFLRELCGLSYRAEIRPEHKASKVQSILDAAAAELEDIYTPLLEAHPDVEQRGDIYVDTRDDDMRKRLRKATLKSLRRSKWSKRSFKYLWRNFRTHRAPLRYVWQKAAGEVEKAVKRRNAANKKYS